MKDDEIRKYLNRKHDPQSQLEKLKTYTNSANLPLFHTDYHETHQVKITPDTSVARSKFIPDPLKLNEYRAHPITIRAMRKELFMGGEDFVDLETLYICHSCNQELDLQFWQFCPFCEASIK
jgi:rubrerythrin